MEEENNNRRLLLAVGICFAVLLLWPLVTPRPPTPPAKPKPTEVASADAGARAPSTPPAVATSSTATGTTAVAAAPRVIEPKLYTFEGEVPFEGERVAYHVSVTNIGGGIERFTLPTFKERSKDNRATDDPIRLANPMASIDDDRAAVDGQTASLRFGESTSFSVPARIRFEEVESGPDRVLYRHATPEGVEIEREYRFQKDSFQVELAVTVRNRSAKEQSYELEVGNALVATDAMKKGSGFLASFVPPPDHLQALCYADGSVERSDFQSLEGKVEEFKKGVRWVAVDRQYFLGALISRDGGEASCRLSAKGDTAQAALISPEVRLGPGEERRHKLTAYFGVKKQSLLTLADARLEEAVDFTVLGLDLTPLCNGLLWVLGLFFGWTGSWGVAIVGLTLMVKLILFPLNQRSGKSMRAMAALRPQLEALKEKYPDDRQRQSEEMMRLYREHNVNPAGGCLPILIQMPIWFALYRSLWVSVDLYQEGFLWIHDLTTRDPLWILPVALIVVMFLQQKMTPTTMDPAQQKIMLYTMPLMFGGMMAALPAGLSFYILVNTLLTIVQQHFINKSVGPIGGPPAVQEARA
jgi:YidC/Oxa1 family membrane protein insertase